jgi:hypothetical protein
MRNRVSLLVFALIALFTFSAQAASKEWLHIHVDETKNDAEKVRINIPLSLIEVMVPLIEEEAIKDGQININDREISTKELKKLWAAVKEEGDAEFVTVEKRGENVRIFTQNNFLNVQSTKDIEGKVNIKIPLAIVDAMLSGPENQLNLAAAVKALKDSGVRDLITVESDNSKVLVWIDDRNTSAK